MTAPMVNCPSCGLPVQYQSGFCPNCGTRLIPANAVPQVPPYYSPVPQQQPPPVSTGPYKVVIAVLLMIIVILGVVFVVSGTHLPTLGSNRYTLANPPNAQSIQPPPSSTPSPPYTTIWNSCGTSACTMQPNGWREGTVPDTYDYFVTFTSDTPITVYFFTLGQFVQYSVCNGDLTCVSGSYASIPTSTSQTDTVFKLAEGCADYVAIYVSSATGTMTPTIQVVRNPYNAPTGYCAQTGS